MVSDVIWVALIEQVVPLITLVLLVVALVLLWDPIKGLAKRATKIGIAGVIEVSAEPLREAPARPPVSEREVRTVEQRVARNHEQLVRSRVLWVDDQPENNRVERTYLRDLGVNVAVAASTDQTYALMGAVDPTVLITDLARPESPTAGRDMALALAGERPDLPVIGYVGSLQAGTPAGFFGITNRPDELVHLLLDVAERQR
ncbi:response regulator [Serinicoccus hydrothermalis]|uniref:response regulator n=1 Tax=Serinicoccus hydrothermalis TaxID=1758689 RepID=UPI00082EF180|nr:response regulator [Serinicoccus hydrothermalis]